jgi:Zn-dependent protease
MKKNMGTADRLIRLIVVALVLSLSFTHIITGLLATVLIVVAAIFALTSLISFCPLYTLVGINTCKTK